MKIIVFLLPLICTVLSEYGDDMTLDKCECISYLHNDFSNPFYTLNVRDKIPKDLKCIKENDKKCEDMCYTTLKEITNNFDLTKHPIIDSKPINVTLGEFICESLTEKNISSDVSVATHYTCHGPNHTSNATVALNDKIGHSLNVKCVDGKFVQK